MNHFRSSLSLPGFLFVALTLGISGLQAQKTSKEQFGAKFPGLDNLATGEWWKTNAGPDKAKNGKQPKQILSMDVPRDEVVAFGLYTHDRGVLKLSAQLFPLKPGEPRLVRLEFKEGDAWKEVAKAEVIELGWSALFRIEKWANNRSVSYRIRHGEKAMFEGLIREDPIDKDIIVVGNLSCNSSRTKGPRPQIIANLIKQDPDFLFFAGDQTYHHTQHTAGWLQWGLQFREIIKNRPVVTIPDDHDVGQGNIWGEGGKEATNPNGTSGGFFYPAAYVNMVQRHQTAHLPDPFDGEPIKRGIGVYYTNLKVGGIDFAILEDRKFKSGPLGKIPKMGPAPRSHQQSQVRSQCHRPRQPGSAWRPPAEVSSPMGPGLERRGNEGGPFANGILRRRP